MHTNSLSRICTEVAPYGLQQFVVIKNREAIEFVCTLRISRYRFLVNIALPRSVSEQTDRLHIVCARAFARTNPQIRDRRFLVALKSPWQIINKYKPILNFGGADRRNTNAREAGESDLYLLTRSFLDEVRTFFEEHPDFRS